MSFFEALGAGASLLGGYFARKENKKARRALNRAGEVAKDHLQSAYDDSIDYLDQGYADAEERLNPYVERGNEAYELYDDALGLNGQEAQQAYFDRQLHAPGFQSAVDYSTDQVERAFANRGGVNSGRALIALADNARKYEYGAYQDYLNRLGQVGNQGYNASGQLAQYDFNTGANKSNLRTGLGQSLANNEIARAGGQAQYYANNAAITTNTLNGLGFQLGQFDGFGSVQGQGSGGSNDDNNNGGYGGFTNPLSGFADVNTGTPKRPKLTQFPLAYQQLGPSLNNLNYF